MPQVIEFSEQALETLHATGDLDGMASIYFDTATLCVLQGELDRALSLAQQADEIWEQVGSLNSQLARQMVTEIRKEG
jgi:isocitrate lyase